MANEKILSKKKNVVNEIAEKINNSTSIVFFDYLGLKNSEIMKLRRKLKENNSEIRIYKNTLTKRALDSLNYEMNECVVGPSAIAFGDDEVSAIKIIKEFSKKNETLKIKGGIIDKKLTDLITLDKLAAIPSREGLLTMLAAGMMGIPRNLSISLSLYMKEKN